MVITEVIFHDKTPAVVLGPGARAVTGPSALLLPLWCLGPARLPGRECMVGEGGDAGEWSHVQFASVTCPQSVCTPCGGNTGRSGHLLPEQKVGRWLAYTAASSWIVHKPSESLRLMCKMDTGILLSFPLPQLHYWTCGGTGSCGTTVREQSWGGR